jgi:hypothetical protein
MNKSDLARLLDCDSTQTNTSEWQGSGSSILDAMKKLRHVICDVMLVQQIW